MKQPDSLLLKFWNDNKAKLTELTGIRNEALLSLHVDENLLNKANCFRRLISLCGGNKDAAIVALFHICILSQYRPMQRKAEQNRQRRINNYKRNVKRFKQRRIEKGYPVKMAEYEANRRYQKPDKGYEGITYAEVIKQLFEVFQGATTKPDRIYSDMAGLLKELGLTTPSGMPFTRQNLTALLIRTTTN